MFHQRFKTIVHFYSSIFESSTQTDLLSYEGLKFLSVWYSFVFHLRIKIVYWHAKGRNIQYFTNSPLKHLTCRTRFFLSLYIIHFNGNILRLFRISCAFAPTKGNDATRNIIVNGLGPSKFMNSRVCSILESSLRTRNISGRFRSCMSDISQLLSGQTGFNRILSRVRHGRTDLCLNVYLHISCHNEHLLLQE